ncbi:amidohydrolase 2 [Pyrenochaeta sp. DS3sAY3a]|nr:amidohydrolase 2 [Pyrenochaeta sp. DS3sAY3a]
MSPSNLIARITSSAQHHGIDLSTLPFQQSALTSISTLCTSTPIPDFSSASRIDTHTHPIPPWFRALEPQAAGRATPEWNVADHLHFMASHGIAHSVLCVSTPQANAFRTDEEELRKAKTIALARLLNEFSAELCRLYPARFSWLAVLPLPYIDAALTEARYALEELGAAGIGVLTNHEGAYPGDEAFEPLWGYLEGRSRAVRREVVFVHPTEPVVRLEDGRLVNSRPSPLRSGLGEFYFETARAISSITASGTLTKFPNLQWRVSHGAGAFPDISERFLLGFPDVADDAREAYKTRFWYDTAGPVFPKQVKGLTEGMGVHVSQFVFGTDYPYGIGFWDVDANIAGLADADFLQDEEKERIFSGNALELWGKRIGVK